MAKKDDYSRHEALHMSWFLMDAADRALLEHDAIKAKPEWAALAGKAHQALYDLYQAIGAEHLGEDKN
jgi:hypothetical protein